MKILLQPNISNENNFEYTFKGGIVTARVGDIIDEFDFTSLPDGELQKYDDEGKKTLESNFEFSPLLNAMKKDGILYLELLNRISENASEGERFPEWIDADDYVFKENPDSIVKEEEDGEVELEE